jgi:hypothetical protein
VVNSALPAPLIRSRLESGKVIPFLGAGASLGERDPRTQPWTSADLSHLPNASELANHLAQPVKFPSEEETRELTKVAKYYELMAGRDVLDEELHKLFASEADRGKLHECLARNPTPLLIISTNYDNLIESALAEQQREFDVLIHLTPVTLKRATNNERADSLLWRPHNREPRFVTDDDLAEIDLTRTFVVYKIHGSADYEKPERDSYVITEDDYIDFLTRMTSQGANAIPSFVAQHIAQRNLLFLGYSLRDWNLRVLLNQMDRLTRRSLTSWAVQYNPSKLEEKFWEKRGVEIFNMKVDEFVVALHEA